ncbi:MAG: Aldo/keto reductase [Clostridiales bacterium]|jgi:predicted aldo/keto reductase-like oxidoreductase|nr:Aldo/keto reductase [Clostridiales bacterium]
MICRIFGKTGLKVSELGFGCMRLPLVRADVKSQYGHEEIDVPKTTEILHWAIDNGVNYIDTAYSYNNGNSELVLGQILKGGYREKVYLADKLPSWMVQTREDMDRLLNESLKRLQTDYIDFYLVHAVNILFWPNLVKNGLFEFLDSALADGRIHYAGFSFHDDLGLFKEVVDSYPWSFCQIQYNYLDENYQAGKAGLEYAVDRGLGVVIMEPMRGGRLASNIPPDVHQLWEQSEIKRSPPEWALRFLWDHPGISVVLSGMNEMEQVKENVRIAGQAHPNTLTIAEKALIDKVKAIYHSRMKVNCTACRYCMPCPAGVNIPNCFAMFNNAHMMDDIPTFQTSYNIQIGSDHNASNCIECGHCEELCPQGIPIREMLKETTRLFT